MNERNKEMIEIQKRQRADSVQCPMQRKELEQYLLQCGQLYYDVWKFGVNAGWRISDILSVTMTDARAIDPCDRLLSTGTRNVKLNTNAMAVIVRRLADYPDHRWLFESTQYRRGKRDRQAVSSRSISRVLSAGGRSLSPPLSLSTHSMRKTLGYYLFESGVHINEIAKALEHSSPATTKEYIGLSANAVHSLDEYVL